MLVEIYTDGACSGNPGPGGWGAYLVYNGSEERISGAEAATTNNRMELMAAIQGLRALSSAYDVNLYSDSSYVINGMKSWIFGWQKRNWISASGKQVKNIDLWKQLLSISAKHRVEWIWVKGHAGNKGNEIADSLATSAMAGNGQ